MNFYNGPVPVVVMWDMSVNKRDANLCPDCLYAGGFRLFVVTQMLDSAPVFPASHWVPHMKEFIVELKNSDGTTFP